MDVAAVRVCGCCGGAAGLEASEVDHVQYADVATACWCEIDEGAAVLIGTEGLYSVILRGPYVFHCALTFSFDPEY